MLTARRASVAFRRGSQRLLDAGDDVVAWERIDAESGDRRVVLVSMGDDAPVAGLGDVVVEVASDGDGEGGAFDGLLRAGTALWLCPSS